MLRLAPLVGLAALAGCAAAGRAPAGPARPARAAAQLDPSGATDPRNVGTLAILDVTLPEAGEAIGEQFAGMQFAQRIGRLHMNDGQRRAWTAAARRDADSVLRVAGYPVRTIAAATSDAERAEGIRFGLSATVERLALRTAGRGSPMRVDATATVNWELLDFPSGRTAFGRRLEGTARTTDSLDVAAVLAIRRSFEALLADSLFRDALRNTEPQADTETFRGGYVRSLPGPMDAVVVRPEDVNVVPVGDPVVRVAAAAIMLRARDGVMATGFVITRDGLAITSSSVVHAGENRLWARFPNGVRRSARIVRERGRFALVQVACAEPCRTVDLNVEPWPTRGTPLVAVGAPFGDDEAFVTATGTESGACGWFSGGVRRLDLVGLTLGGEPVARADDGTVVGVVTREGCAMRLAEALRTLNVRLEAPGR